ncbi:Nn.00g002930.m01.CDS01 [Neocucurbitaria sp. VM-36]
MDAHFNSSDIECDPAPPDPFSLAGAHSVNAILKHATEFRIESKKAVKQLQSVSGAPVTRMQRARWGNAWNAFYTVALKKSDDSIPTGEDLARFLLTIPKMTQTSYSSREMLSWSTLQLALKYTIHTIRCQHDTFKLSYNDQQRIKDCFETLRIQNKITKESAREAQWLTTRAMTFLNRALLVQAIRFGVPDWSIVVQKCLGLALQSACSCRVGDASVSRYYEDNECLVYKDIQLKVTLDPTIPSEYPLLDRVSFEAKITMRHTKGKKRDPSRNHIVVLASLDDVEFNVVDPLKLLLAHALRHDAIETTTNTAIDSGDFVQQALARRDNLVQWKYPERPLLCALTARKFDYDKGAQTQQLLETLNEAAILSGISQRLVTHDIRRGAAADAAQLRPSRNMVLAAEALDHTNAAVARESRRNIFGLQTIDARRTGASQKKRKVARAEIDDYLARPENAHLNKLKAPRHAATRAINKHKSESFANELLHAPEQVGLDSVPAEQNVRKALQSWNAHTINDKMAPLAISSLNGGEDNVDGDGVVPEQVTRSARSPRPGASNVGHIPVDISNIDPALLLLSGISTKVAPEQYTDAPVILPSTQPLGIVLDEMMLSEDTDDLSTSAIATAAQLEMQILEAPASSFVAWLSQINTRVVNDTNPAQHSNLDHLRGGSRDEPTFFLHHCRYESQGCTFTTVSGPSLNYHEATCTPERRQSKATNAAFSEACDDASGCSYVARGDSEKVVMKKMRRHKGDRHNESLVTCPIGGRPSCAGPFKGPTALSRHKRKDHSDIVPQRCPVAGCKSKTLWNSAPSLDDHIRKTHYIKGEELSNLVKAAKSVEGTE